MDSADLVVALKSSKPSLVDAVTNAMSKRAAEGLKEEMESLGAQRPKEVEAAQDRIIQVVRKLEEAEEITIETGGPANAFA